MRLGSSRRVRAVVGLCALIGQATVASGVCCAAEGAASQPDQQPEQDQQANWLVWKAPPECPGAEVIEAQVRAWIGEVPRAEDLRVQAAVSSSAEAWTVHIVVQGGGTQGERDVSTTTCADAAQLVAIAAALAMAPDDLSIPRPEPQATEASEVSPSPPTPAPVPAPAKAPPVPKEPSLTKAAPIPWSIGAGAALASGLLPGARGALTLSGAIDVGRINLTLRALWFPAAATSVASGAAPIDLTAFGGSASLGYGFGGPKLSAGPSLGGEAGAVIADQRGDGAARSPTAAPWFALLIGGRLRWSLLGPVGLELGADLVLPLIRPDLVLNDGTAVHRADPGVRGLVEISFESNRGE